MLDIDKFIRIEKELAEEYGSLTLFALFLRQSALSDWDVIVAADWLNHGSYENITIIANKLKEHLSDKEMLNLAKVVPIRLENPGLDQILNEVHVEHESLEIRNTEFFDIPIRRAIFITSQRTDQKEFA